MSASPEEQIVKWVTAHSERESFWVNPDPQWYINSTLLLDAISAIVGISKEQIEQWVNEENTRLGR